MGNIIGPVIRSLIHERHSSLLTVAKMENFNLSAIKCTTAQLWLSCPLSILLLKLLKNVKAKSFTNTVMVFLTFKPATGDLPFVLY